MGKLVEENGYLHISSTEDEEVLPNSRELSEAGSDFNQLYALLLKTCNIVTAVSNENQQMKVRIHNLESRLSCVAPHELIPLRILANTAFQKRKESPNYQTFRRQFLCTDKDLSENTRTYFQMLYLQVPTFDQKCIATSHTTKMGDLQKVILLLDTEQERDAWADVFQYAIGESVYAIRDKERVLDDRY